MSVAARGLHGLPRVALALALALSAFGVYESIDAFASLLRSSIPDSPMAELFRYEPWASSHFVPGALFLVICPVQLWGAFRNADRRRHRIRGWTVMTASTALGLSGLLFPFTMPSRTAGEQVFMTCFGLFFLVCTIRALGAARHRDFATHRRWAIRLYVNGLTITTQRLFTPVFAIENASDFWFAFVGAGWLAWAVHASAAEWWLWRPREQVLVGSRGAQGPGGL